MKLSNDEAKALGFVALLLTLAGVARIVDRQPELELQSGDAVDLVALERASMEALAAERRRRQPLAPGERIDPNTAPADELARLPGVGSATADRIVAARENDGPFSTTGDLTRVRGIGTSTAERLAPHLRLPEGPPGGESERAPSTSVQRDSRQPPTAGTPAVPIDVNRATAVELEGLPGIGPVIARRIVAYRDSAGPFRRAEELELVPGIGPATRERLASLVVVRP